MPPVDRPKVKIKITGRFTDEQGGRLYAPGEWDVYPDVAARLVEQGKAKFVNTAEAPALDKAKAANELPVTNPRIPETKDEGTGETEPTPLPENFPSRDILIEAGFGTVESLKDPDVKEKLAAVKGLGPASITKIGLAISAI